jgi:cysteine synthase A
MGRRCGGSTGTNLFGVFELMNEMRQSQQSGSVVTLICDDGNRYQNTYFDHDWLRDNGHDIAPWVAMYQRFFERGEWVLPQ